ncbi:MAG: hypothetical protein WD229_07380 [Pirellulales bacterium]
MPPINKPLLRLAVAFRAQLATSSSRARLIGLPVSSWHRCVELVRQIRRAELRGWQLAAAEISTDLRHTIAAIESELESVLCQMSPLAATQSTANTSDIYRDLVALGEEFDEVSFDLRGRWLSVTTEPLELERIYLGPFEIRLDWAVPRRATFQPIAQSPAILIRPSRARTSRIPT